MKNLTSIETANESNWLWPSIADAVDTFIRRREHADDYERIWRLIHIWEALATTLSGVIVCRLRSYGPEAAQLYLKVREHLYGVSFDKIDKRVKAGQGAFDGSNDKRIEILRVIQKAESLPGEYLKLLKDFLNWPDTTGAEAANQKEANVRTALKLATTALLENWKRVCDVPNIVEQGEMPRVIHLIGMVNTFRNRYAHVPFPYDPISSLADALEQLTEALFSIEPSPGTYNSVLSGGLSLRQTLWRGCMIFRWKGAPHAETFFVFPGYKPSEEWSAGPFVFIDANKRPYVLTRLKDRESGTWEYTRYRAEANSVIGHDDEAMLLWVAAPADNEYEQPGDRLADAIAPVGSPESIASVTSEEGQAPIASAETEPSNKPAQTISTQSQAIEAMRQGQFAPAIEFFKGLIRDRPNYHIGFLRLGYAQRELAARLPSDLKDEAIRLLDEALRNLSQALNHVDVEYRARAVYERSKTYYRKYVICDEARDAEDAYSDAMKACSWSPDPLYSSWIVYLERKIAQSVEDLSSLEP